jgi:hypothetical protein
MSWELLLLILGLCLTAACAAAISSAPVDLYISPDGDDTSSGTLPDPTADDGPFASLERARDEIRRLRESGQLPRGAVVHLRGGRYELDRPFALTTEDSGSSEAPIIFSAYQDEEVILSGGRTIPDFRPVEDPAILDRLSKEARGNVLQADLKAAGIEDFGTVAAPSNRLELFFAGEPMTLSRWPDDGFVTIDSVFGEEPFKVHGIDGDQVGKFTYTGDRPSRWTDEPDVWLHGYWFWDWSDQPQQVKSIDSENRTIELEKPYHNYGYRPGQRFYALNLLCELDRPGEWYLDRRTGLLYFWPPEEIDTGRAVVSILPSLITIDNASSIDFQHLHLEATRGTAITINGGSDVHIAGCIIANIGSWAVSAGGGNNHSVVGCDIYQTGEGGISLSGGDRPTLTPAGHLAENNHIHQFGRTYRTYRPAVSVTGVGIRVAHNLIHDGPHNAIQLSGNDHQIEFNEIYDVCYETGDVGAFYMGRDWTARGTVIRHNFFHHIRGPGLHGAMAVYLDDAASGIQIAGNIFYRASRAAFIGGGRDNLIDNNIFVDCDPSVHVDARGIGWMAYHVEEGGIMPERLAAVPYREEPWSSRYPQLLTLLDDEPGAPKGNVVRRNISVGGPWSDIQEPAVPLVLQEDNLIDQDPHFVDPENLDFRLRLDSPAWDLGFQEIPIDRIGPYADPSRATWPVAKTRRTED